MSVSIGTTLGSGPHPSPLQTSLCPSCERLARQRGGRPFESEEAVMEEVKEEGAASPPLTQAAETGGQTGPYSELPGCLRLAARSRLATGSEVVFDQQEACRQRTDIARPRILSSQGIRWTPGRR